MTQGPTFRLESASTSVDADMLRRFAVALAIAGMDLSLAWGLAPPTIKVGPEGDEGDVVVTLLESIDVSSAAGYHTVDSTGVPRGFVLAGSSVSTSDWQRAASHEVFETMVDPQCNRWAQDSDGRMWALEVCDPVQVDSYTIDLCDGGPALVISDWCTPAWFTDPQGGRKFDRSKLLDAPWTLRPGGYAITIADGIVQVPGPQQKSSMSRWARRLEAAERTAKGQS